MKESVAIAKEANTKKDFSPTRSEDSIHRLRDEPERQLGSLRAVIGNIRRNGGTPSVESISTELSVMPSSDRASALLALQQTHGNQYVQRVVTGIQAKLAVGQPGDKYEQEADRVAEQVMNMPEPQVQRQLEEENEEEKKKKEKRLLQAKPLAEQIMPSVQGQVEEEEELQAKELSGQTSEISPNLEASINAIRGGGQPLPASTRTFFEPRFGYDFSQVRVHTDAEGDMLNHALNARAFTTGQDIFLRQGEYNPGSSSGRKLLAHELTHVVQQRGRNLSSPGKLRIGQPGNEYEIEANRIFEGIVSRNPDDGAPFDYNVPGTVPVIAQPSGMTCWATVATMMMSWRYGSSLTIEGAMDIAGPEWRTGFDNNRGLSGADKGVFLAAIGLHGEPPTNYTVEGLRMLLETYGPLWGTTDEDPTALFAIHARIITGIYGDGTIDGTRLRIIDPAGGSQYEETFGRFSRRYEEVTEAGPLRVQIAHF